MLAQLLLRSCRWRLQLFLLLLLLLLISGGVDGEWSHALDVGQVDVAKARLGEQECSTCQVSVDFGELFVVRFDASVLNPGRIFLYT